MLVGKVPVNVVEPVSAVVLVGAPPATAEMMLAVSVCAAPLPVMHSPSWLMLHDPDSGVLKTKAKPPPLIVCVETAAPLSHQYEVESTIMKSVALLVKRSRHALSIVAAARCSGGRAIRPGSAVGPRLATPAELSSGVFPRRPTSPTYVYLYF